MSEENLNLKKFFSIPIFLSRITSVKLDCDASQFFRLESGAAFTLTEKIELIALLSLIIFDMIAVAAYLFFGELDTKLEQTAFACYTIFVVNAISKGFTIWSGRRELELVFQRWGKNFPMTPRECEEYQLHAYYRKIHNQNKSLAIFHMFVTTLFNIFPVCQAAFEYYADKDEFKEFEYKFPFLLHYWFDEKRPGTYWFTYITQCLGGYCSSCWFLSSDLLLITTVHLINMHLNCLSKRVKNFKPTGTDADIKNLEKLVVAHKDILDCCELVDQGFSKSILANYIGTGLILCLIGFQVVIGTEILHLIKFMLFLISMTVHVYFISVCSNTMIDLGSSISDAFFHHQWYNGNLNYQRLMTLPIARSQRPAHLTAYKFFIVSMETFKTFMTTSYQMFTLIRTSLDEDNK